MIRRTTRVVSLSLVALLSATLIEVAAAEGWKQAPPLPDRRWLHLAAAAPDGRVAVYAGRLLAGKEGSYEFGRGKFGIDIYERISNRWRRGPPVAGYRLRYVREYRRGKADGSKQWVEERGEHEGVAPEFEAPNGGGDGGVRAYWFSSVGAIFFDMVAGVWGQTPSPTLQTRQYSPELATWTGGNIPAYQRGNSANRGGT